LENEAEKSVSGNKCHLPPISRAKPCGQVVGIGNVSLFIATPYATARFSIPWYGI